MAISSFMVPLGTAAPDFSLRAVDGSTVSLGDFESSPALLVAFLCNHCPYVQHIEAVLGPLLSDLGAQGLATVAVCSNDVEQYPADGPDGLREQAARARFAFPYLMDSDQT